MAEPELLQLAAGFGATSALVLGDVMLDEYVRGPVRRISPEAPVPVVEVREEMSVPGGAANTAAAVAALGGEVHLIGIVGMDSAAERLRTCLRQRSLGVSQLVVDSRRPTTVKARVLAGTQQLVRMDWESRAPLTEDLEETLIASVAEVIRAVQVVIISDYAKGVVSPRVATRVIEVAAEAGVPVVVDPKGPDWDRFRGATVLTPNLAEAALAAGVDAEGADVEALGRELGAGMGGAAILLTRGPEGMTLFPPAGSPHHVPALVRHVYDVTGAGDTVVATVAQVLAAGGTLHDGARLATVAAGVVVGKVGTSTVTADELVSVLGADARFSP